MEPVLQIKPRYYRWHVNAGLDWLEENTGYAHLDWQIPLSQAGLVLVDVWDRHYLKDIEARAEAIIQENIRPLLQTCRRSGLEIIHAPAPPQAQKSPAWIRLVEAEKSPAQEADWPPPSFRTKSGSYAAYARPHEPRQVEIDREVSGLQMHPDVCPEGNEVVIATGEELHLYCKQKGILFLFFLGFNTNACVLERDYGTLAMYRRGYEVIIVRDCTTGMESVETREGLEQTRGAILNLEMFNRYSVLAEDLIAGLAE